MPENPIPAIENAELAARQTVQKAQDDKASLIENARRKAEADFSVAVANAQAEGERMSQTARQAAERELAALDAQFEQDQADLARRAAGKENAAIRAVIKIIGGKMS